MSDDTTTMQGTPQPLRQNLVDEASKFLSNPNVVKHGVEQKTAFLRKKGLTEVEITAAYDMAKNIVPPTQAGGAGAGGGVVNSHTGPGSLPYPVPGYYTLPPPPSGWVRVRDTCNLILVLSGASYGLYLLYKKFVVPWLTGRREKTVEESMVELQQSVVTVLKEVQTTLDTVQHTLTAHSAHLQAMSNKEESQAVITPRQLDQLRNEVSSIKGLMIGKRTFPSTPNPAPSIPSWQLSKTTGKPVEETAKNDLSVPIQTEVKEASEVIVSDDKMQQSPPQQHFTHHVPEMVTSSSAPNGNMVGGNSEAVATCGSEDSYENSVEESEGNGEEEPV